MKTITIEELEALKDAEKTIVDIRPQDQYMRGTFPGAVSLPASRLEEQYEEETARLDKMHPVYVMCHTGEKSQEWVRRLTGDGFDGDWMKEVFRVLGPNRRVFVGKNLYTKGELSRVL